MAVTRFRLFFRALLVLPMLWSIGATSAVAAGASANAMHVTILYDAFGKASALKKDWGYSAFIEYAGPVIRAPVDNLARANTGVSIQPISK